jgi:hypothetical protein
MDASRYQTVEIIGTTNKWQSYFRETAPDGFVFAELRTGGIVATQEGDQAEMTVTLPATPLIVAAVEDAISAGRLVQVQFWEFDSSLGDESPNGSEVVISQFLGEVIGGSSDFYSITMRLGSSLSSVGAQVPPRRFTTKIIGTPCRL